MTALVETVLEWDGAVSALWEDFRWQPLTAVFVIASMWWVKWPLMIAVGSACESTA